MPKYNFTEEQEKEIIEFYLEPNSLNETCKHFGFVNKQVVIRILKKYNIATHSPKLYRKIQVEKTIITNNKKYGCNWASQTKEVQEKMQKTCMEKYGVTNGGGSKEAIEKIKIAYWTKSEEEKLEIKEKRKQTVNERFGYNYALQVPEIQEAIKNTNLKVYGVENVFQAKEIQEKAKQTNLERYGTEYYQKTNEFKEKYRETCKKHFGVENYFWSDEYKQNLFNKYQMYHAPFNKYKYQEQHFDSFPELCLYMYCKENDIEIIREPAELTFTFEDKEYHYYPDFLVNNQLVEIKGKQFLKEDGTWCNPYDHSLDKLFEAKHQCALQNNVKILYQKDYQKYIDWFNTQNYKKEDFLIK